MIMKAQLFSSKGHLGSPIEKRIHMVSDVTSALLKALDKMPDTIEEVSVADWTKISIELIREG